MLRLFRSRWFLLSLITIMMLVIMGISSYSNNRVNWLNNMITMPLAPIQSLFSAIGRKVSDGVAFFKDTGTLRQENYMLKVRMDELEKLNRELASFKLKNEELRQALNLKVQFDKYTLTGANIIAVDPGNWFNIFKIDLGSKDGIKAQYPVITNGKGLIGRILSTDVTSAKVLTIIDEESAVAGWISKAGGGHVIVRGDLLLKEKGLCRMDFIPLDVDVEAGDIIETSGLGGIFPKGILIGRVVEVKLTNSEISRYAIIEPAADFKRLEEVYVLKGGNDTAEMGSVVK